MGYFIAVWNHELTSLPAGLPAARANGAPAPVRRATKRYGREAH